MRRIWLALSAVLLPVAMASAVVSGPANAQPVPMYEAVELGAVSPHSINTKDVVVGAMPVNGRNHPFLWRAGVTTDLGDFPGSTNGWGVARDVNDRNQAVGTADGGAFLWDAGVMTALRAPGFPAVTAEAINNLGQITGTFLPPSGVSHGYLWERGRFTDLGEINPVAINDRGQVLAGRWVGVGQYRATIWRAGHLTDLNVDHPVAINNQGWVAGMTVLPDYSIRAVLWRAGTATLLGTLGGMNDRPTAINDRGQVLGTGDPADGLRHAILWQNGRTIDLAARGIVISTVPQQATPGNVSSINNRGHITAEIVTPPDGAGYGVLFR
jgi:probable HAF family extracellular repeat protein